MNHETRLRGLVSQLPDRSAQLTSLSNLRWKRKGPEFWSYTYKVKIEDLTFLFIEGFDHQSLSHYAHFLVTCKGATPLRVNKSEVSSWEALCARI
jgi:hypothetical protein